MWNLDDVCVYTMICLLCMSTYMFDMLCLSDNDMYACLCMTAKKSNDYLIYYVY